MKWKVNVFGCSGTYYEISVLREEFKHGQISYGWNGPEKIIISSSGGPCGYVVPPFVFDRLVKVAVDFCAELNQPIIETEIVEISEIGVAPSVESDNGSAVL
jgi:hypothetical protein